MSTSNPPTQSPPPNSSDDFPKYLDNVELELVNHILSNIDHSELTMEEAGNLAQDFLDLLPAHDKKDLLDKLNSLSITYKPAREVYAQFGGEYEEAKRQQLLNSMREHIKNGNIEQAIAVAKGGNTNG